MKALGVVRKIDELGRVTIPKEVRRTQGWNEGDPMEFFMDGSKLVIQSYEGERQKSEAIQILEELLAGTAEAEEREDIKSVLKFVKGDR